jgi:hypothetical protein
MSMELYVAAKLEKLPTASQIGAQLATRGITVTVEPFAWATQSGYLPVSLDGRDSGVEVDLIAPADAGEIMTAFGAKLDPGIAIVAMRWGGDLAECCCACALAAAIAQLAEGQVLDPEQGRTMTIDETISAAIDCLNGL